MPILTNEIIEAAIGGLEAKKQHIDTQTAGLALKQFSACGRRSGGDGRR